MKLKLKPQNILVFTVRAKEKFKGLYTPQKNSFADYYDLMPVWIADMGPDCGCIKEGVGLGAKVYLKDAFELEPLPGYIADIYAPLVDFGDKLLKEVDEFGGYIQANIVHEAALMGIEESSWKKNPRLSWGLPISESQLSGEIHFGSESASSVSC